MSLRPSKDLPLLSLHVNMDYIKEGVIHFEDNFFLL